MNIFIKDQIWGFREGKELDCGIMGYYTAVKTEKGNRSWNVTYWETSSYTRTLVTCYS
jgi:hypothetical protein